MKLKTKKKKRPTVRRPAVRSSSSSREASYEEAPRRERSERRERRGPSVGMILIILLCACLLAGMITLGVVAKEVAGNKNAAFATEAEIDIPEGSSTDAIGLILKDNGIIGSKNIFKAYCRLKGVDSTFQPGPHVFDGRMSYAQVIEELQTVVIAPRETFQVTFPDGITVVKMGMILEDLGVCKIQDFVTEAQKGEFTNDFLQYIPNDPNIFVRLEGYLYPETYQFYKDDTPHEWIQAMLDEFEKRVCTPERMAKIESSGLTFNELVTFASIVEKEYSAVAENENDIAQVFWNRLNDQNGDYLYWGSCVSGWYDDTGRHEGYINNCMLFYNDNIAYVSTPESMEMAYDTYRGVQGLPIGPMYNMKVEIIDAVLNPSGVPYTFFYNDKYGNTYWSMDYSGHQRNITIGSAMTAQYENGVSEEQARINTGYNFDSLDMTDAPKE